MSKGFFNVPYPKNEPVLSYAPGSKERAALKKAVEAARAQVLDIPMYIGAEEVRTGNKRTLTPPHDHQHVLAHFHEGDRSHVEQAIRICPGQHASCGPIWTGNTAPASFCALPTCWPDRTVT